MFPESKFPRQRTASNRKLKKKKRGLVQGQTSLVSQDEAIPQATRSVLQRPKIQSCQISATNVHPYRQCNHAHLGRSHSFQRRCLGPQPILSLDTTPQTSHHLHPKQLHAVVRKDWPSSSYRLQSTDRPLRHSPKMPMAVRQTLSLPKNASSGMQHEPVLHSNIPQASPKDIIDQRSLIHVRSSSLTIPSQFVHCITNGTSYVTPQASDRNCHSGNMDEAYEIPQEEISMPVLHSSSHQRVSLFFPHPSPDDSDSETTCFVFDFPKPPSAQRFGLIPGNYAGQLSPKKSLYLQALIRRNEERSDPLWTALLQGAMREKCVRELCIIIGRMYVNGVPTTDLVLKGHVRSWNVQKAVNILNQFLSVGGTPLHDMVKFLRRRLKIDSVEGGWTWARKRQREMSAPSKF
ncbi:BgTH12-01692 [Blumeria graminis f. sp. triticale]|nr:BgTH12-01692 [Blumeria graminis f. sp. triticale]